MPKRTQEPTGPRATKLRFIGGPDQYVAGVPQADLEIVAAPASETQVTLERARELVATRLFVPEGGDLPRPETTEEEGAPAPEED